MAGSAAATLNGLLERTATVAPDLAVIVASDGGRITAADLLQSVRATAAGLIDLGVRRGGTVVSWLPNIPEWYTLHLAAARVGAITIPLNTRFRREELSAILARIDVNVLAVPRGFLDLDLLGIAMDVLSRMHPAPRLVVVDLDVAGTPAPTGAVTLADIQGRADAPADAAPEDLVVAFTTSGTTGSPKLVSHDNRAVTRHARNVAQHIGLDRDAVLLGALPLCGAFGYAGATAALAGGATVVLQEVFDPDAAAAAFPAHGITHCYGSEVLLRGVLEGADRGRHDLSSWRFVAFANFSGEGEAVAAAIEQRLGLTPRGLYGASELFAFMTVRPADAPFDVRVKAGGTPIDRDIEIRIASDDALLGAGEPGELQVRGYNVTRGYLGDADMTAAAFTTDGWYRSGDLGELAPDGSLTFLSRMKDTLRLGGFLVDPTEIEERLTTHPSVRRAQVVGVESPGGGDMAVAFVQLLGPEPLDTASLRAFCRERAAAFKVPSQILAIDAFPVVSGPNGDKIDRSVLREKAAAHLRSPAAPGAAP